ncbi:MAG: DNA-binding protein [Nitrospirales bacterium]|nr:MAG: DNA-binding protein [Nitrospirales bacterium]
MTRYVVDASVAMKWFIPEIYSESAIRLHRTNYHLHAPGFIILELGNVLGKKIRRNELSQDEGEIILKEMTNLSIQRHANDRLFHSTYALALDTQRSLYDCLYLALAETIDGKMVTADGKFYKSLLKSRYRHRLLWVEDLPQ